MSVEWTLEDLAGALREVAAERPDHVYESYDLDVGGCYYWHVDDDAPGCIFGHAFHRLGLEISDGRFEDSSITTVLRQIFGGHEDDDAYAPFLMVQSRQDGVGTPRKTWGKCVEALDPYYPL